METKDLIEFVNNPNFIPGIYNYCDRWCERCAFSTRCSVYAIEREENRDEPDDINSDSSWKKLASILMQTKELIVTWAKENNVDLSQNSFEEIGRERMERRRRVKSHRLAIDGEKYASAVTEFFEKEFRPLDTIADTVETRSAIVEETDCLRDAVDVIQWYQFFIAVKTMRGLMSRENEGGVEKFWDRENFKYRKDSDGSIKVALIAMDRSINAWRILQLLRPEFFEPINPLIATLENLRKEMELEFPHAREFIRAGFDEPEQVMVN
jgi:hypothetical protein